MGATCTHRRPRGPPLRSWQAPYSFDRDPGEKHGTKNGISCGDRRDRPHGRSASHLDVSITGLSRAGSSGVPGPGFLVALFAADPPIPARPRRPFSQPGVTGLGGEAGRGPGIRGPRDRLIRPPEPPEHGWFVCRAFAVQDAVRDPVPPGQRLPTGVPELSRLQSPGPPFPLAGRNRHRGRELGRVLTRHPVGQPDGQIVRHVRGEGVEE
jgi:hypothetical protein